MKLNGLKLTPALVAAGVIGVVCAVQILLSAYPQGPLQFFDRLEQITYDLRVREALNFSPPVATNLGFVEITDKSIERISHRLVNNSSYGLYWPRHVYGRVARELKTQGARVIGFDVLFSELRPDHSSLLFVGQPEPVESDVFFAQLLRQAGNVVLAAEQDSVPPSLFRANALALGDITAEKDSDGVLRRARAFRTYRKWDRAFQQVADDPDYGVDLRNAVVERGQITLPRSEGDPIVVPIDAEGRFDLTDFGSPNVPPGRERHPKAFTEERVWHMGIVLAARELKLDLDKAVVQLDRGRIILRGPGVERTIPVDKDGYFYINWCLTEKDRRLTHDKFDHVIEQDNLHATGATNGLSDEWKWKGKLAIVGSSATGNDLTDRGATPLQKDALLVSKHWNVANSVLTNRFIRRAGLPMELTLICVMGAIATVLISTRRVMVGVFWVAAVFIIYAGLALLAFAAFGEWLPMVLPMGGGLLVTYGCLLTNLVIFEQREQRHIKSVFGTVVSQDVMQVLIESPELSVSGARRGVTVLFADIRGFTEMTDRNRQRATTYVKEYRLLNEEADAIFDRDAQETLETVNRYLKTVADVVLQYNGTIDKFIGDCVMAFWGAPVANPKHALHCVRAAIAAQQAIFRLNQEREAENSRRAEENLRRAGTGELLLELLPILSMGSGINTGVVTVGLMGSEKHYNYTVFGGDVNLASRLESVSGRGRIIISEATLAEIIQDDASLALACVKLPSVTVKGISEPVHIYEVPWRTGEYAPTGDTVAPPRNSDTMPPFRPGGHDTSHVRG